MKTLISHTLLSCWLRSSASQLSHYVLLAAGQLCSAAKQLCSAAAGSFALPRSGFALSCIAAALLCSCSDNDGIFNIEPVDLGSGFCIMPVSMIGEEIPYDSVPGEASGDSRAINAMTVDRENMIKKIAIFQFDKENNLRTLKNGQYYLYKDFAVFGSSTPNGVSLVNIDNMPELAQLLTSTKSDLYTCVIANASQELIEDAILPGGSPTDWPNFKEYSFPLPMATKADVENERDNLEYGHVTDIYMFGYYDGVVPPTGFTLGLGRVVSRIKIKFEAYENEEEHVSLDNLPSTARFFAAIRNLPRTGYFYPTTETPIQKSISDVYMLPELQFNPKSGSAILQFYCGPQLGSWIAEEDNTGTPLRTQLLLWCATNPEEYENADWNQYFLEQNLGKAVAIEFGNNPGAGDYGIVHNTVYSYTMGLGYGTSGIVIKPINIFAMVWLDQYNDWKWESNIGQESNPLILNIDSRASKHNFEIKKIFNRVWEQRNDYGFVEYMIRNKRDWTQVALKDNSATLQDDQIHFDFSTLNYSNLDTDRLMLVGATENNGVYTGLETEGVKLLPLANGTATFDINLAADYETTINGTATNFTSRTVHVTVPINGTFSHSLLPSKAPVSVLAPGTTTDIDDILADVSFKPIKTYNGYTVHTGDAFDIPATDLTVGTPVISGTGITIVDGQIVAAADAEGTVTIPYTYPTPSSGNFADYKYPQTLSYNVEVQIGGQLPHVIWEGSEAIGNWDKWISLQKSNSRYTDWFENAQIDDYFEIELTVTGEDPMLAFRKYEYGILTSIGENITVGSGKTKIVVNSEVLAAMQSTGLHLSGKNITITKITLFTDYSGSNIPTLPEYKFGMTWLVAGSDGTSSVWDNTAAAYGYEGHPLSMNLSDRMGEDEDAFKLSEIFSPKWEVGAPDFFLFSTTETPQRYDFRTTPDAEHLDWYQVGFDFSTMSYAKADNNESRIIINNGFILPVEAASSSNPVVLNISIPDSYAPKDGANNDVEIDIITHSLPVNIIIDGSKFEHTITAANEVTITNGLYLDNLMNSLGNMTVTKKYDGANVNTVTGLTRWNGYNIDNNDVQCTGTGVSFSNGQFTVADDAYGSVTLTLHLANNNGGNLQTYKYPATVSLTIPIGSEPVTIDKTLPYTFTLFKTDPNNSYNWISDSKAQNGGTALPLGELGTDFNIAHLLNYDTSQSGTYGYIAHTLENVDGSNYNYVELKKSGQVQSGQQEYDFSGLSYTTNDSKISITTDNKIIPLSAGTATFNVEMNTVPDGYTNIATPASVPVTVTIANSFSYEMAPTGSIPGSLSEGSTPLSDFLASADFKAIKKYKNTEVLAEAITLSTENCEVTTSDKDLVYLDNGNLVVPTGATGSATITFTYTTTSDLRALGFPDTLTYTHTVTVGVPSEIIVFKGSDAITNNYTIPGNKFSEANVRDILQFKIESTNQYDFYFGVKIQKENNWTFADIIVLNERPNSGEAEPSWTITSELIDYLKTNGIIMEGREINLKEVKIVPAP